MASKPPAAYAGISEAAAVLGVTRQRAARLAREDPLFPRPLAELAMGKLWDLADVEAYRDARAAVTTGGRRRKAPREPDIPGR